MKQNERGYTYIELAVLIGIAGIMALMGWSAIGYAQKTVALVAGTSELRSLFHRVRSLGIVHNRNVAIRFRPEGKTWSWTVYEDGDGDGVRNDDIVKGIDKQLEPARRFQFPPVRIDVPMGSIPDPSTGELLSMRLPVRFGTSFLCSFTREGEASNGSIVVTDGTNVRVIRVDGHSALVSVLRWDGSRWVTTS
jgi:type II secretory pathway pseudopilin PulG